MKNLEKKNWETPAVTKLAIKDITQTGKIFNNRENGKGQGPTTS